MDPKQTAINKHASPTTVLIYKINTMFSGAYTCDRWPTEKKAIPIRTAELWNPNAQTTDGSGRTVQRIRDPEIDFSFSVLHS